ncbi:unnamed protein product [Heligmosomoides polygyrus]|uniref:NADP-dependent oxidoreductase domain-containing protein n=1 Tax=Heligmosomoides polygyrus TaxID=6339 RepID=A0A3P7U2A1_HELPZ|nr:unnamed protein product [Heligmosomoides polygyrus]
MSYRFIAPSNQYFVAPRWNSSHPLSHGRNPFIVLSGSIFQIKSERILTDVVDAALSCGYRFFDTAQVYGNEAMLGRIFQELLPKYNLDRSDIFITSKVSPANQGTEPARKSLANLQTDYLDLMLIHWPGTSNKRENDPKNAERRRQTYEVLEEFHGELPQLEAERGVRALSLPLLVSCSHLTHVVFVFIASVLGYT